MLPHLPRQFFREHGDDFGVGGIDFPGFQGALGGRVAEDVEALAIKIKIGVLVC
jgi:hypothetical protein